VAAGRPNMMLRETSHGCGMNFATFGTWDLHTIRLEGSWKRKEFLDLADQQGILVMAGWCWPAILERWPQYTFESPNNLA